MSELSIVKLLRIFTRNNLSEFDKFLRSPLFNNQTTLLRFFRTLKKYYPGFPKEKITKEYLFKAINPEKKFNSVLFRKYHSELFKLAEKYLLMAKSFEQQTMSDLNLLELYEASGLHSLYLKKEKIVFKKHFSKEKLSFEYFKNKCFFHSVLYNYRIKGKISNKFLDNIKKIQLYQYLDYAFGYSTNLRKYYMQKYYYRLNDLESFYKKLFNEFSAEGLRESEAYCTGREKLYVRLIIYDIKLCRREFTENDYQTMRKILFSGVKSFSQSLLYYYFACANTYCIEMRESNHEFYTRRLFENYKFMLNNNLMFSDNRAKFLLTDYNTILYSALTIGEFNWAEKFIVQCKENSYTDNSINIENYSLSVLNFFKGNFEKCIEFSSRTNLHNFILRLGISKITMKAMYEIKYLEMAKKFASNYKYFIKNLPDISEDFLTKELSFIKFYTLLLNENLIFKNNLAKEISESPVSAANKKWLIDKLNLLVRLRKAS